MGGTIHILGTGTCHREGYSLVSNRRGVGIVGGLEKISKINSRGGTGKNLSDSHFLYIVTVRL